MRIIAAACRTACFRGSGECARARRASDGGHRVLEPGVRRRSKGESGISRHRRGRATESARRLSRLRGSEALDRDVDDQAEKTRIWNARLFGYDLGEFWPEGPQSKEIAALNVGVTALRDHVDLTTD